MTVFWGLRSPHEATAEIASILPENRKDAPMPAFLEITCDRLSRLIGTPNCPALIDVRIDEDFDDDPRLIPGSRRFPHTDLTWVETLEAKSAIVICQRGKKLSHGVAAWLRHYGIEAEVLE